jgi:hypothetical protein
MTNTPNRPSCVALRFGKLRYVAELTDRLLLGRYRLLKPIGRGGMGTVWWARDEEADREVAVKEIHLPSGLSDADTVNVVKRTHREALAAGRLRHPGLVSIYDVIVDDGRPWLIMEYVPARSLEDVVNKDGPLSPPRAAEIGLQLLAALTAAHQAGIVHRDVKPSNVLLSASGRVVLTDFGIATWDGATTLTQAGTFMGSPAYVAPEVARGQKATPGSDLWSLGTTLYHAVEGRPPYDHETAMATLSALITSDPDPPRRAGPLRPAIDALLRKDPAKRATAFRTAELLTQAVREGRPATSPAQGVPFAAPATKPAAATRRHQAGPTGKRQATATRRHAAAAATRRQPAPPSQPPGALGTSVLPDTPAEGVPHGVRTRRLGIMAPLLVAGGLAAVLAVVLVLVLTHHGKPPAKPLALPATSSAAAQPAAVPAMTIEAVGGRCHVRVSGVDGVLFTGVIPVGGQESFSTTPLLARVTNLVTCQVTIRGHLQLPRYVYRVKATGV